MILFYSGSTAASKCIVPEDLLVESKEIGLMLTYSDFNTKVNTANSKVSKRRFRDHRRRTRRSKNEK